jgi:hypothetical protein
VPEFDQDQSLKSAKGYTPFADHNTPGDPLAYVGTRARIAIYDDLLSSPRVIDVNPAPVIDFIEGIASNTHEFAQKMGGSIPYTVIREIAENFIHANFRECTISILDKGNTIKFSDQGPGIEKKRLVQQPGISSATAEMKRFIKGVGSGFPIVKEYLEFRHGYLTIDDNAKEGSVITISIHQENPYSNRAFIDTRGIPEEKPVEIPREENLDTRSLTTLRLLYEKGELGPNDFIEPLGVSAPTAHRILVGLNKKGLIESTPNRKRILSSAGFAFLEAEKQRGQGGNTR